MTMSKEYNFVGMGNPLLDISAVVTTDFLEKYNLKANDAILAEEKHKPIYAELINNHKVEYVAGGAAQNAMRGAQWLLPPKSTIYIGAVGKDKEANQLRTAAANDGLRTDYMEVSNVSTGRCAVLITDIHRSLVTDLLAANEYKISHLKKPEIWKLVENANYFYVEGYFITVSQESILEVAKHCAENNKHFTMNLSAPFIPQFFTQQVDQLEQYWDVLFGNESEALAYAEAHKWETKDIAEIALLISKLPKANSSRPRTVVFTQGSSETIVAVNNEIHKFPIVAVKYNEIVDTNGCGDAYCGGFMSQYVQGKDLATCCAAGAYVAGVVIKRMGPTYPRQPPTFKSL